MVIWEGAVSYGMNSSVESALLGSTDQGRRPVVLEGLVSGDT